MIGAQLQQAIFSALTSASICGGRIYDRFSEDVAFPRVMIGDEQVISDGNSCGDAWEVFSDIHVFSRPDTGSKVEAKTILAEIVTAIKTISAVDDFLLVSIELQSTRTIRDPDGLTEHSILTFRSLID